MPASLIDAGVMALGLELSSAQAELLVDFLCILTEWNRRFSLVGTDDTEALVRKHLLDCLLPSKLLGATRAIVDVGSGAGLPGIPLAVARPELTVILVDSRRVCVSFLREVVRRLRLSNAAVREGRIEDQAATLRSEIGPDAVISRAWVALGDFLGISAKVLTRGGIAISMKGPGGARELSEIDPLDLGFRTREVVHYTLPGGGESRMLLVFERI
jgi:16S rRNA (guanine527-N7)-methyltransferase